MEPPMPECPSNPVPEISQIMTADQEEAMLSALSNPLILHKIIEASDFPELKIVRCVNSAWNLISCHVILKRQSCFITFRCHGNDEIFYKVSRNSPCPVNHSEDNLSKFNTLLVKSYQLFNGNFPCTDFKFIHGDLGQPVVHQFFQIHGPHITSLRLRGFNNDGVKTSKQIFCQILLNFVPKIQGFYLTNFEYDWSANDDVLPELPFLQKFKWIGSPQTASKILQTASNPRIQLPLLNLSSMEDLEMLEKFGKIHLVKDFLYFGDYDRGNLTKFANLGPKLPILRISDPEIVGRHTSLEFQKILNSSRNSLEIFQMSDVLPRFGIVVPRLENLKKLILVMEASKKGRRTWRIFPARINLSQIFPSVHTLDCGSLLAAVAAANKDESWDKVFPPPDAYGGHFEGVRVLKIFHNCSQLWLSRLHSSLCPNFKKVIITHHHGNEVFDSQILSKIFQSWVHLTAIEISLDGTDSSENFEMDPAISGIPKDVCNHWLFSDVSWTEIEDESDKFAHLPSIRDLHELKELSVRLRSTDVVLPKLPFSRVSGLCSFKRMPSLKVVLQFDHQQVNSQRQASIYEELAPFVNIRHHKIRTH